MPDKKPGLDGSPDDDGIVRHYNRERRLSRASPEVRWIAGRYGAKRPGILGSLLATGPLRFMFFSLLLFMAAGALLSFLAGRQDSGVLGNQLYKVSAFRFGQTLYITVTREARSDPAYIGPLRITGFLDDREVVSGDYAAGPGGQEEYRMTAPSTGTAGQLALRIEAGGLGLKLTTPVR